MVISLGLLGGSMLGFLNAWVLKLSLEAGNLRLQRLSFPLRLLFTAAGLWVAVRFGQLPGLLATAASYLLVLFVSLVLMARRLLRKSAQERGHKG